MPYKNKSGIIPLVALIIAGIVFASAGGVYIVRKEFIKKGQSGKAALDEKQISEQISNPVALENPSPDTSPQLAPNQYKYVPEGSGTESKSNAEPGFTIIPPSGWSQKSSESIKVGFLAPKQDEEPAEPPLVYMYTASIQISVKKHPQEVVTLKQAADATIEQYKNQLANIEIISNTPTTLSNQEAQRIELKGDYQYGHKVHVLNYVIIKNGYTVGIGSLTLDSAWQNKAPTVQASISSFKFTDS